MFGRKDSKASESVQVAIVEDEEDLCHCIRLALDHLNITSATAHDGEEGLRLIREHRPKLILLDIKMPRKNGYQVLAELQLDPQLKNLPVFVMTSLDQESKKTDEQWAHSLGVCHFISKPFNPEALAERIAAQLQGTILPES